MDRKTSALKKHMSTRIKHGYLHHISKNTPIKWPSVSTETTIHPLPSHLHISGTCQVDISGINSLGISSDNPMKLVVGCWLNGDGEMAIAHCDKTNSFSMNLKVPENPSEILKTALYADMVDSETGFRKLFPLQTCGVHIQEFTGSANVVERCSDLFNDSLKSTIVLTCDTPNIPVDKFQKSALRRADEYNRELLLLGDKLEALMQRNNLRSPIPAQPFMHGLTFAPFVGMPSSGIPALRAHYALFGAHINRLDRTYPMALPCYFFMTAMMHSAHTMEDIESLILQGCKSRDYLDLVSDSMLGFTKDAMCMSYQRDGTPVLEAFANVTTGQKGVRIGIETTEDVNIVGYTAALETECDVDLSGEELPKVSAQSSMAELQKELFKKEWPEMSRCFGKDDCESSAFACCLTANTYMKSDWSVANLKKELSDFKVFSGLSERSYAFMSRYFNSVKQKLISKEIQISTVVGLAGGASAIDVKDTGATGTTNLDQMDAGGHCFAIMKAYNSASEDVYVKILEGTNSTLMMDAKDIVPVSIRIPTTITGQTQLVEIDTCQYASAASKCISAFTQICNHDIGFTEQNEQVGWQAKVDNAGITRSQMAINCGDPAFYKWLMFVGTSFEEDVYGHVPCSLHKFDDNKLAAGCSPQDVYKSDLMGLNIDQRLIQSELFQIGVECMNEITPPIAPRRKFAQIVNTWAQLPTCEAINRQGFKKDGLKYACVSSMESFASPLITPIMYYAKKKLVDRVNEINMRLPNSDGSYLKVSNIGTGVTITLCFPIKTQEITIISSLKQAIIDTGYSCKSK